MKSKPHLTIVWLVSHKHIIHPFIPNIIIISTFQKGDAPGLPARGGTPRWLTDTKYLSPLIVAYEDMLKDKQDIIELCQTDLEALRKEAEGVVQENQRLHGKMDQIGQPSSVTPAEWWDKVIFLTFIATDSNKYKNSSTI